MNLERLINMVINQVIRRVINVVIDRGFGFAKRQMMPRDQLTENERSQRDSMDKLANRPAELKEMGRRQF